jgi:hypothetical protein
VLRPPFRRRRTVVAAAFGLVLAGALGVCARLYAGPIAADWLKPGIERALAGQVPGGRAQIGHASLAWFGDARSLGVALDGVRLVDHAGREVVRARRVEAAFALDALPGFSLAPGRLAARDFFAAVSVSPKGRYELGYDASGTPEGTSSLGLLFRDLTGKSRWRRPASFLRQVDLADGRLALRQVGSPLAWTADVDRMRFRKSDRDLTADVDLRVDDGGAAPAALHAKALAAVGLRDAFLTARVDNLVPARVFPSVGSTRTLSALDAVVHGRGSLSYDFKAGVRAADVAFEAGKGVLRFGDAGQDFDSAEAVAYYDRSGEVRLSRLRIAAEKTQLDLTGSFRLAPEDVRRHKPASLEYALHGPKLFASFAADSPPQELTDVSVVGRLIPEQRRLEIDDGRARIAGAPLAARGAVFRDARGRLGARLAAKLDGTVGREQVFALWPEHFVSSVRGWLFGAVLGGRFDGVEFNLDAPAGEFQRDVLRDEALNLRFGFADAGFRFAKELPPIAAGVGVGVLQGNRFDLSLASGRIDTVNISDGVVEIPAFHPRGKPATFKVRAVGDVRAVLQVLDGPGMRLISGAGFSPARASGDADVKIEIVRPMVFAAPFRDYRINYEGTVRRAGVSQAALGWDLTNGDLQVKGDEKGLVVAGPAQVGPYRGPVKFAADYGAGGPHAQTVDLDGVIQASILMGKEGRTTPFGGKFRIQHGAGTGLVRSPVFEGRVNWKTGTGERFALRGWGDSRALEKLDVPFMAGMPDRFPTELTMARVGAVWRGPLRADALSGAVTFTPGDRSRLVYEADLTPIEARRLGLGKLPLFDQTRRLVVDAAWAGEQGTAQVRAGGLGFSTAWAKDAGGSTQHRLSASLSPADLAGLGAPVPVGVTTLPVSAVWRSNGDGLSGIAEVAGTPLRFQSAHGRNGAIVSSLTGDLDRAAARRWGLPEAFDFDGSAGFSARWATAEGRPAAGRVEFDLTRANVSFVHSDWRKPAGRPARVGFDFAQTEGGFVKLSRLVAAGEGVDVQGAATLGPDGRLVAADLPRARLNGLIDASLRASRDAANAPLALTVRGKWLDARRLFEGLSGDGDGRAPTGTGSSLKIDAALDGLRLTDDAQLRDVRAVGGWGDAVAERRLDVTAATVGGGRVKGRLYPSGGFTAIAAETADTGELARTLFGLKTLRGGRGVLTGRLVDGGADLDVEIANVRLVKAPTMAQILTLASLQGLADTLNGEGVMFNRVVAPVQVRGRRIIVGEARATGQALGLTTKGVADLGADTLNFEGTIAPAYALNAAVGNVPVLGQLLTSRKGEGVVGLGYQARGSFEKPQVRVNPLSLMTPGILRRMFETPAGTGAGAPKGAPASKVRVGEL